MFEGGREGRRKEGSQTAHLALGTSARAAAMTTIYASYLKCIAVVYRPHTISKSLGLLLFPFGRCQNWRSVRPGAMWLVSSRVTARTPGDLIWRLACPADTLSCTRPLGVGRPLFPAFRGELTSVFLTNSASWEEQLGGTEDVGCTQVFHAKTSLQTLLTPTVLAPEGP